MVSKSKSQKVTSATAQFATTPRWTQVSSPQSSVSLSERLNSPSTSRPTSKALSGRADSGKLDGLEPSGPSSRSKQPSTTLSDRVGPKGKGPANFSLDSGSSVPLTLPEEAMENTDAIQYLAESESRQPSLALSVREGSMVLAQTPSLAMSVRRDGSMALSEKVDDEPGVRTDAVFRLPVAFLGTDCPCLGAWQDEGPSLMPHWHVSLKDTVMWRTRVLRLRWLTVSRRLAALALADVSAAPTYSDS